MLLPPPTSTLFPYTTLFRSLQPKTKVCRVALCADIPDAVGDVRADRGDRGGDVDEFQNQQQHQLRIDRKSHTSELQSRFDLVCRLLLEKKKNKIINNTTLKT